MDDTRRGSDPATPALDPLEDQSFPAPLTPLQLEAIRRLCGAAMRELVDSDDPDPIPTLAALMGFFTAIERCLGPKKE